MSRKQSKHKTHPSRHAEKSSSPSATREELTNKPGVQLLRATRRKWNSCRRGHRRTTRRRTTLLRHTRRRHLTGKSHKIHFFIILTNFTLHAFTKLEFSLFTSCYHYHNYPLTIFNQFTTYLQVANTSTNSLKQNPSILSFYSPRTHSNHLQSALLLSNQHSHFILNLFQGILNTLGWRFRT